MKKYILMLAAVAATTLVACGNKEANAEEVVEPVDSVEVVEEVVEVADSAAAAEADTVPAAEIVEAAVAE